MGLTRLLESWPVVRQLRDGDPLGLGRAVQSERSKGLRPRIDDADQVARSICPFCAVGCAQPVYVKDGEVIQIEGDPASPISRGRLCPKGAASQNYVQSPLREYKVKYRRPYGTRWEELSLDEAMEMIVERTSERVTRHGRTRPMRGSRRSGLSASPTSAARRSTSRRTT